MRHSLFHSLTTRARRLYQTLTPSTRDWVARTLKWAVSLFALYVVVGGLMAIPVYRGTENWVTRIAESIFPYPAMSIEGTVIPLSRYRTEVAARQTYANTHSLPNSVEETRQFVIDQLVSRSLYAKELEKSNILITDGDVDQKLNEIYEQVGGKDKLAKYLQQNYGDQASLAQFRLWVKESLVEAAVKKQLLTHVTVRHILVAVPEDANQATVDTARAKALDIKSKIASVDQFGAIAKEYSEDIASKDKGGELGTTARGDVSPVFSEDFEKAAFSIPVGEISTPVRSKYGWHILLVESREGTVDMNAPQLLEKLKSENSVRLFVKAKY
ncbi:MAG TPA: peptidylprolyl isomerase [Verrucomicrobiae bacterium]|nr:peptidylprolyl isomerase [Verrucomicrobiae bacterium]